MLKLILENGEVMKKRFETFTVLISKINRCIKKIKSEEMSNFNLKTSHVSCLYYLYKNDNELTAKELCDICDEDKAAISRAIDYLETEGFIACESKTEKRYKSPLSLTEKGRQVGEMVSNKVDNYVDLASIGLSESDRKIFYNSLILISDNLQQICDNFDN